MTDRARTEQRIESFSIAQAENEYAIYYRRLADGGWARDVGEYDENGYIVGEDTVEVESLEEQLRSDLDEHIRSIACTGISTDECLSWVRPLLPADLDWISINDTGYDINDD